MKTVYDADSVRLLTTHLTPIIGKKLADRVAKCATSPSRGLIEAVIRPQLFTNHFYTPVSDNQKTPGRNHEFAMAINDDPQLVEKHGIDPLETMTYFANPLRVAVEPDAGDSSIEAPKDRVVFARFQIFTFEFDRRSVDFLRHQFEWVNFTKNKLECPIGKFYLECSRFSDFAGISVIYSGNKSLHIHVVFDTSLVNDMASISLRSAPAIRRGLIAHWKLLEADLTRVMDTEGYSPDPSLRFPEQYRRMPNAVRRASFDNLPGFPIDSEIPQTCVWEKFRQRASGDEMPLFFRADLFALETVAPSEKLRYIRPSRIGPMTSVQLAYCEERMRTAYPDFPRFHNLSYEGGRWIARFFNSETDRMPSSIMREDHMTIQGYGVDSDLIKGRKLPAPLADMLRLWREQMPGGSCAPVQESDLDDRTITIRALEDRFRTNVIDKVSAYDELRKVLRATVTEDALLMVTGPEGIGKTTTLFEQYHLYARRLLLAGESARGLFAFADYEAAEEKCARFDELQSGNGFIGVVLPSFSRLYEEACAELKANEMTRLWAIREGYRNVFDAISRLQPNVIKFFQRRHRETWKKIGTKIPVFFVVHQTMHLWRDTSLTRLMWAPSFWSTLHAKDQNDRIATLRAEMTLGLAVHDEVKTEHIVDQWPAEVAKWVIKLTSSDIAWAGEHRDLGKCLESFENFQNKHGDPLIRGDARAITFDEVLEVERLNERKPDAVIARDSGEYQIKALARTNEGDERVNVYEAAHGAEWRLAERDWWDGLAQSVVLLTTEAVPTAIVEATTSAWRVVNLVALSMPKNAVRVYAERSLTGQNLPKICTDFREMHPDMFIISNKAKHVINSMPHVTARGSNSLIGKHVMQTMTHMTPVQYEKLQVLNAWTGRSDLVGMSHIDEFNQSAGRNLGFRWTENGTHALLINRRLFRLLAASEVIGAARYSWEPVLNKDQRTAVLKKPDPTEG